MKLFLSSMSPINKAELLKLIGRRDNLTVSIIPNAWDVYSPERKNIEVKKCINMFIGFDFKAEILLNKLKDKDMVWVMGGNTFYLNYYVHKSGFFKIIKKRLEEGLVYGDESAGTSLAGMTIHEIEHLDDKTKSPETIWDGLKLVDYGIIPHWGWDKYGEYLHKAKIEMEEFTEAFTLNNDEALVINGSQQLTIKNPMA